MRSIDDKKRKCHELLRCNEKTILNYGRIAYGMGQENMKWNEIIKQASDFLVVQWLTVHSCNAQDAQFDPWSGELRSHKSPYAMEQLSL